MRKITLNIEGNKRNKNNKIMKIIILAGINNKNKNVRTG